MKASSYELKETGITENNICMDNFKLLIIKRGLRIEILGGMIIIFE